MSVTKPAKGSGHSPRRRTTRRDRALARTRPTASVRPLLPRRGRPSGGWGEMRPSDLVAT